MTLKLYNKIRTQVIRLGYNKEIELINQLLLKKCDDANHFFNEYVWVVVNAGMKNQVAELIFQKIMYAIENQHPIRNFFGHQGKVKAINYVLENKEKIFLEFVNSSNKIEFLDSLPYIGEATKYHLARNLGFDFSKPDRHLLRIAKQFNCSPEQLCSRISKKTGDKVGVVDVVIWRAANLRLI